MITTFVCQGYSLVTVMHGLNMVIFYKVDIIFWKDIDSRIRYTERILKVSALNNFESVLFSCKETVAEEDGAKWTLGDAKSVSM